MHPWLITKPQQSKKIFNLLCLFLKDKSHFILNLRIEMFYSESHQLCVTRTDCRSEKQNVWKKRPEYRRHNSLCTSAWNIWTPNASKNSQSDFEDSHHPNKHHGSPTFPTKQWQTYKISCASGGIEKLFKLRKPKDSDFIFLIISRRWSPANSH